MEETRLLALERMQFTVAIVQPDHYPHSPVFQEIAETIHYGLLALGHDSQLVGLRPDRQLPDPDRWHIVLGSNLLPLYPMALPTHSILYNLEQLSLGSPWMHPNLLELFEEHLIWDYSQKNLELLASFGIDHAVHVPIGYMPQLSRLEPAAIEDVDVLFYGSMNPRRRQILEALEARGVKVQRIFGVYGAARDAWIARAKIVLNLHLYDAHVFELVRVSYLLANHKFVISEVGTDPSEQAFASGVVFAAYEDLVDVCLDYLNRPDDRRRIAASGFQLMVQHPETDCLNPAVQLLELLEA